MAILLGMLLVGGLSALIVFSLFYYYRTHGATIEFARIISVNALVMMELFYLFNCRFIISTLPVLFIVEIEKALQRNPITKKKLFEVINMELV